VNDVGSTTVDCDNLLSSQESNERIEQMVKTQVRIPFSKYEGLGNDFVMIDNRKSDKYLLDMDAVQHICDRHFGVGADGVLFAMSPTGATCDYKMRIFMPDGSEEQMCGNGIRCMAKFLQQLEGCPGIPKSYRIDTLAGIMVATIAADGLVKINMGPPTLEPASIPCALQPTQNGAVVNSPIEIDGTIFNVTAVSMGNPHCVTFVDDLDQFEFQKFGPLLRNNSSAFPEFVHVEFVQVLSATHVRVKVWERGAGPTLACGTGSCAVAVASQLAGKIPVARNVQVSLPGGDLFIDWMQDGAKSVFMTGPAELSFHGTWDMQVECVSTSENEVEKDSMWSTTVNLTSAVLGAGILTVPYAFEMGGWFATVVVLVMGFIAGLSSTLIAKCLDRAVEVVPSEECKGDLLDWPLIGRAAYGRWGQRLVNMVFQFELYGIMLVFLVLNGQNAHILFPSFSKTFLIVMSGVITFILLYVPRRLFGYLSFIGVTCNALIVVAVAWGGASLPAGSSARHVAFDFSMFPRVIGLVLYCFIAHAAIPTVYRPMKNKKSFPLVSAAAFAAVVLLFFVVGALAYYFFGDKVQKDVNDNIARDLNMDPISRVAILRFAVTGFFATNLQLKFPLFSVPLLHALESPFALQEGTAKSSVIKLFLKLGFVAFITSLAVFWQEEMIALSAITGSLFASCTAIIFPAWFFLKLAAKDLHTGHKLGLILMCVFGFVCQVVGTIAGFADLFAA